MRLAATCFILPDLHSPRCSPPLRPPRCLPPLHALDNNDGDNESLDSLSIKLEEALDKASMTSLMPQFQVLNSRLPNLSINRVYTGPSMISGQGLFALRDCPSGTLLTCYPGDGIVEEDDEVSWGDHVNLDNNERDWQSWDDDYLLYMDESIGLVGLPELNHDPAYLGHFANDGVLQIPMTIKEAMSGYLKESQKRANAMERSIFDCHMGLVATRNIEKDEEIFLCYGAEYWIRQL